ncbi:DUF7847 domain-containing protein [Streptomyces sp. NBC_00344]|uniref:DUF7847 domain-containing protein n=1 Tax=Streptomyces sp. NBC_00344 TaxID=2975720 RepID=UPI002E21F7EA
MAQDSGWGGAYGGAPHGGAPGWGAGWGGWIPPQAPKPGVIPLQPLRLSDILGGAAATVSRYWKQLLGIAATVYGGAAVLVGAALAILYAVLSDRIHTVFDTSDERPRIGWHEAGPLVISFLGVIIGAALLLTVCTAVVYATCAVVLQEAVLGRPTTYGAVWRRAWSRMPSVIGTLFLSGLIVMLPLLLIAGVAGGLIAVAVSHDSTGLAIVTGVVGALALAPPAAWLWVLFTVAPAAVVFERQGPIGALRRSARLVRGSWWRTCGISLLGLAIGAGAGYFIQLPFSIVGMFSSVNLNAPVQNDPTPAQVFATMSGYLVLSLLGQTLSQIISATFPQLVNGLLYVDLRIRREDLAPALVDAASHDAAA